MLEAKGNAHGFGDSSSVPPTPTATVTEPVNRPRARPGTTTRNRKHRKQAEEVELGEIGGSKSQNEPAPKTE